MRQHINNLKGKTHVSCAYCIDTINGIPGIITKLIRTVNYFIGKENTGIFSQAIANQNQNSYWLLRGPGELLEVLTMRCPKKK